MASPSLPQLAGAGAVTENGAGVLTAAMLSQFTTGSMKTKQSKRSAQTRVEWIKML